MKAERARLARLNRLEHVRAIARTTALAEAGLAEARLDSLARLGQRTQTLITAYAARDDAACGADLARQHVYVQELQRMAGSTRADITRARAAADARAAEASVAERRRAAVETRATATRARIDRHADAAAVPLTARKVQS